jgi:hypothetical protein
MGVREINYMLGKPTIIKKAWQLIIADTNISFFLCSQSTC